MGDSAVGQLRAVPEQVEEPILVEGLGPEGRAMVVEPTDPGWAIAWLWREKDSELKAAERDLRTKRAQVTKLQREKLDADESERKSNPSRDFIFGLFDRWREGTNHTRAKLTPERFDYVADRLAEDYSEEHLKMAIEGLIADAWTDGKGVKRDDWKVAVKDGEAVERYANKCPKEKREEIRGTLFEVAA